MPEQQPRGTCRHCGDKGTTAPPKRVTDQELERLILRAIADPGHFVQRHHADFGWPGEPETIPHWGMRAVFAALVLADKDIVDHGSTVAGMARLLDQLRRVIDEFEHDPAQALACVREWLDGRPSGVAE